MKPILVKFFFPNQDAELYDSLQKELEDAGLGNVPERLYHIGAPEGDGWHIIDVWESEQAFINFSDAMLPILVKKGGRLAEPTILPIYKIIAP